MSSKEADKGRGANLNSKMGTNMYREALRPNVDHQIDENIKKMNSLSLGELGPFKIQVNDDKRKCFITDMCAMLDGTTLVVDFNNEKIKRLDSSYNVVDYCELPGHPYDICRAGPTEVAITLRGAQKVQFVSVTSTLTPTKSFRVGETCRGIAYSRGQLFVTCGGLSQNKEGPGEVRVYSLDGKLLHNLPQTSTNQRIWSVPLHVAVSPDGCKVIVSDKEHLLVTMNRDGSNVVKTRLPGAETLCVQDQSVWFACNSRRKGIFRFNTDGSYLGVLLTEENGIDQTPWSVCYHREGHRLVVGFHNYDFIKVFQLRRK